MTGKAAGALFNQKTVENALKGFTFPPDLADRHQKVQEWITSLKSGRLAKVKEVSLHGPFLNDIFQTVLGYRSIIGGDRWELHAEQTIADGGGSADGAIGLFHAKTEDSGKVKLQGRVVAPIELKGVTNDLDRAVKGRHESAVDQGWRYANYTPDCRWVIVSNYREIRLYQTSKTPAYYERFRLEDLEDLDTFKQFYFLLCRNNFLPASADPKAKSRIDQLLIESANADEDITKALYQDYKKVRLAIAKHFLHMGPADLSERNITLIAAAQKVLDRILFIAFCEDRGLLPEKTLQQAHDHQDPYSPRTIWENFKAVFQAVDKGNSALSIPGYNGGLFAHDPLLDEQLMVSDILCSQLNQLTTYDFESEVSVNILGHIFEQSVSDLEELRAQATHQAYDQKQGRRKTQGVYYTPAFITQYIVGVALGEYLERKKDALWEAMGIDQIRANAVRQRQRAEIQFWERYRDEVLTQTRVIDPACGSGAFLIAAFDFLNRKYEEVNERLAALKTEDESGEFVGQRSLFDLTKTILNQNLYGVDLSPESVEITKLSLWLKTAERGKTLTYLDNNIKVGNSIIADPAFDPAYAFDWEAAFPVVFASGGFDVVIGNPPYVRQELLTPFKPYLQEHYAAYDGVADIYVYFYEKGLNILRPNGILSYIVTNKWLRAGYGEPLRQFFSENSVFEQIIDFGHAPIFEDADVFPCIVSVRKPEAVEAKEIEKPEAAAPVQVCPVPREHLENINLPQYINQEGYEVPWARYGKEEWSLESPAVEQLMDKLKVVGVCLNDFLGTPPLYGLKTGYNKAFLIDQETRDEIVSKDSQSVQIIKPYLRGQDINRWNSEWQKLWMIMTTPDIRIEQYPGVKEHLEQHRERLDSRAGRQEWWQLQSMPAQYKRFEKPKIIYQEIQFHPSYCYDTEGYYTNNKCFILATEELFPLAVLNSPIGWWHNWRYLPHMKDEALTPKGELIENFPIAPPTDEIRAEVEPAVQQLIEFTKANQEATRDILDWLQLEHGIEKPGNKLSDFASLPLDDFLKEVKKRRPKAAGSLGPKPLKELKAAYSDYAHPIQQRRNAGLTLEHRISDLVNQAYGLTPEEIDLMWKTAPPRMPFNRP
ncbi:class I SAM-dependent DNA methyltransferase [Leptolyngbya iicbica LK]|uniref:site-specific DNA-methyltransferase (adenine-specific) n=3 Tax=Cyanophyceae TaxID=3028117 RepID=A0A4Q7EIS5_9CYAN|nr:class I SAM-dependent DNA methyltransferase [Leptolyngbya sp. LK]